MLMVYKRTKHPWEDWAVLIGDAKRMRERERSAFVRSVDANVPACARCCTPLDGPGACTSLRHCRGALLEDVRRRAVGVKREGRKK